MPAVGQMAAAVLWVLCTLGLAQLAGTLRTAHIHSQLELGQAAAVSTERASTLDLEALLFDEVAAKPTSAAAKIHSRQRAPDNEAGPAVPSATKPGITVVPDRAGPPPKGQVWSKKANVTAPEARTASATSAGAAKIAEAMRLVRAARGNESKSNESVSAAPAGAPAAAGSPSGTPMVKEVYAPPVGEGSAWRYTDEGNQEDESEGPDDVTSTFKPKPGSLWSKFTWFTVVCYAIGLGIPFSLVVLGSSKQGPLKEPEVLENEREARRRQTEQRALDWARRTEGQMRSQEQRG